MGLIAKLKSYSKFTDADVFQPGAFNPGLFSVKKGVVKKLRPDMYSIYNLLMRPSANNPGFIQTQMNDGDIQTAVVVSTAPLLVACYTEDFDAVILQYYPDALGKKLGWSLHTRLLTVNTYNGLGAVRRNKDIDTGPHARSSYKSAGPLVADLFTDNVERLERKKREIPEAYWQRTLELGNAYMLRHPGMARNGLGFAFQDAKEISKIKFSSKIKLDAL